MGHAISSLFGSGSQQQAPAPPPPPPTKNTAADAANAARGTADAGGQTYASTLLTGSSNTQQAQAKKNVLLGGS